MNEKSYVIRIDNIFYFSFFLWYSMEILFSSTIMNFTYLPMQQLNDIIGYIVLVLMIIQIFFFQKYNVRDIIVIVLSSVIVIVSAIKSGNNSILSMWIFIVSSKKVNLDAVVRSAYKVLCFMVSLVIILFFFKIIPEVTLYRNGIVRHSMGFIHPNQLGLRVFQLIMCRLFLHRNRFRMADIVISVLGVVFVYYVPNSQTSFGALIILFFLTIIYAFIRDKDYIVMKTAGVILISTSILLNVICVVLSTRPLIHKFWVEINQFISFRFSYCYRVYKIYGITFWGNDIAVTMSEREMRGMQNLGKLYLDNAYLSLILRFGILMFVLFSLMYYLTMYYFMQHNQLYIVIIMFVYSVYGIMETGMYQMSHNIILLAISYLIYNKIASDGTYKYVKGRMANSESSICS